MWPMIFQQLFETITSTYTYILADEDTHEAVIIDSVLETVPRDLNLLKELELELLYTLDTHVHADHITGSGKISHETGAKIAISAEAPVQGAHVLLQDGEVLKFGKHEIKALATPGHTNSRMCFHVNGRIFTGDTLMIRTNGRTDFQEGSPEKLFNSIHKKLYSLPDNVLVYPGHDYKGFTSSTIGAEKKFNARINARQSLAAFNEIMKNLNLPPPKKMHIVVPANLKCGLA